MLRSLHQSRIFSTENPHFPCSVLETDAGETFRTLANFMFEPYIALILSANSGRTYLESSARNRIPFCPLSFVVALTISQFASLVNSFLIKN
jgi:hypothetical protein